MEKSPTHLLKVLYEFKKGNFYSLVITTFIFPLLIQKWVVPLFMTEEEIEYYSKNVNKIKT